MVWSLLSALIWTISEPLCKQYHWIKYLHTHVIWHIGISYGMYNLLQFMLHYHLYHKAKTYYVVKFSKLGIPYIDVNVNKHHMQ